MKLRFGPEACRLLAALVLLAGTTVARAEITCTNASMGDLSFGEVNSVGVAERAQTTLIYSCSNDNRDSTRNSSAMLCFSLGFRDPYMRSRGTNRLYFNLYQDAALTLLWGSQFGGAQHGSPLMVPVTLPAGAAAVPFRATLYGIVPAGQNKAEPGAYSAEYQFADTALTVASVPGDVPPADCERRREERFPFHVIATISPRCVVAAGRTLDFGTVQPDANDSEGSTNIDVACTFKTPYSIGLSPSNGSVDGAGLMRGSRGDNRDRVPYQLTSTPGRRGRPWGNDDVSADHEGNGVSGSGKGATEVYSVYATVPDAAYAPDSYSDTVTVTVYY
ncbi:spore coat U domain-containing protein [Niveibacterium sp. SC-1]|uniref:Csu type fimbrial protein n=1 Tax=Niveibacterium sp. SC-1 TaxID=3135646 RepID=UPI00311F66B5